MYGLSGPTPLLPAPSCTGHQRDLVHSAGWWHKTGSHHLQSRSYQLSVRRFLDLYLLLKKDRRGKQCPVNMQFYNPIWILEVCFIISKNNNNNKTLTILALDIPSLLTQLFFLAAALYFATSKYRGCSQYT